MIDIEKIDNYDEAVSYIMMIPRFSGKNAIDDTRIFYHFLKEPGNHTKIIHVAGTNGKGSVCAYLQSILLNMDKKVGLFTSPHLITIRERIMINREMVSKEMFYQSFCLVRNYLKEFKLEYPQKEDYHPSFFEMLFFIAMIVFQNEKVDEIILETGLGGRLDATNVVTNVRASVITEIGFDHMEYLGDTLEKIAYEKAGIILEKTPVIFWNNNLKTEEVIKKRAAQLSAPCTIVSNENGNLISIQDKRIDFSYKSRYYEYVRMSCNSIALYQFKNALLALRTIEQIFKKEEISKKMLIDGIYQMHWEGRMEEILPNVYLDGAHNEDGITALLDSIHNDNCTGKRYLLFSAVSEKQVKKMVQLIFESRLFEKVFASKINSNRGLTKEQLEEIFNPFTNAFVIDSPEEALRQLLKNKKQGDIVYVAGSLYLVGQLKKWIKESKND